MSPGASSRDVASRRLISRAQKNASSTASLSRATTTAGGVGSMSRASCSRRGARGPCVAASRRSPASSTSCEHRRHSSSITVSPPYTFAKSTLRRRGTVPRNP